MYMPIHRCAYISMYICILVYADVCTSADSLPLSLNVHTYIYLYIYIYTHLHTYTKKNFHICWLLIISTADLWSSAVAEWPAANPRGLLLHQWQGSREPHGLSETPEKTQAVEFDAVWMGLGLTCLGGQKWGRVRDTKNTHKIGAELVGGLGVWVRYWI